MARNTKLAAVLVMLLLACPAVADHVECDWVGGTDTNWGTAANWDPASVPQNTGSDTFDANVDAAAVNVNGGFTIQSLTLGSAASVSIVQGRALSLGAASTSDGVIRLADTGSGTADLRFNGAVALNGSGSVLFDSRGDNRLEWYSSSLNDILTLGAAQTVTTSAGSAGKIIVRLVNNGVIDANNGTILLSSADKTNASVMKATNGGILTIDGVMVSNAGGTIMAGAGSTVKLDAVVINGGTIDGSGLVQVAGGTSVLDDVQLTDATIVIPGGSGVNLRTALTNDGTIRLQDTVVGTADLRADGAVTLSGTGSVLFDSGGQNRLEWHTSSASDSLTLGAGQTVATTDGADGVIVVRVTNNGLIDADNGTILLNSADKINAGVMQATNGGTLTIDGVTVSNAGATITAGAGSTVVLDAATIDGGTIDGSGLVQVTGGTSVLDDVQLTDATVAIPNGSGINLRTALTNDGTIRLQDTAVGTADLRADGAVALNGPGSVLFDSGGQNRLAWHTSSAADVLTIGASQTVATTAGSAGSVVVRVTNNGVIDAAGGEIELGSTDKTNAGVMKATAGGTLTINSVAVANAGGTITAGAGSTVALRTGASVTGGTIDGTGLVPVTGYCDLADLTIDGPTFNIPTGAAIDVTGTIVNSGTIELEDTGVGTACLRAVGSAVLNGTGQVVFPNGSNDNIISFSTSSANDKFTIGPDMTITTDGAGTRGRIDVNLTSAGTIRSDGLIELRNARTYVNTGLIEVLAGGVIDVDQTLTQTAGATMVNGTLTVGGLLDIQGGLVGGSGAITGQTNMAGTFSPGNSVGTLTFNLLHIDEDAGYHFDIDGAACDLVHVSDIFTMDPNGPYTVHVSVRGGDAALGEHTMITWAGDDPLTAKEWAELYLNTALTYTPGCDGDWIYDDAGNRMYIDITQVPEPATLALLGFGAAALLRRRRR